MIELGKHINIISRLIAGKKRLSWFFVFAAAFVLISFAGIMAFALNSVDRPDQSASAGDASDIFIQKDSPIDESNDASLDWSVDASNNEDSIKSSEVKEHTVSLQALQENEGLDPNEINGSSLNIKHYVNDGLEDGSFSITYNAKIDGTAGDYKKAIFHYCYVDYNEAGETVFHENALPSCQPNNLCRDVGANTRYTHEQRVRFEHFVEEINYNKKLYTFQSAYAFKQPGDPSSVYGTQLYRTEGNIWCVNNGAGTWINVPNSSAYKHDIDIYFVFKPIAKAADGSDAASFTANANKGDIKASTLTIKSICSDGNTDLPGGITSKDISLDLGDQTNKSIFFDECVNKHIVYRNITEKSGNIEADTYTFNSIRIGSESGTSANITDLRAILDDKNIKWQYKTSHSSNSWTDLSSTTLYIIYDTTTPTLDSKNLGVKIKLFDYDAWADGSSNSNYYNRGINQKKKIGGKDVFSSFKFSHGGTGDVLFGINQWTNAKDLKVSYGIFKKNLVNGFPNLDPSQFSSTERRNTNYSSYNDLKYLFNEGGAGTEAGYKSDFVGPKDASGNYEGLNHFFDQQAYDQSGIFHFSSSEHFSSLNRNMGNFVAHKTKSDNKQRFMPFDYYKNLGGDQNDFLYSMTIDTDFIQPEKGKKEWKGTKDDMKFTFEGDDDVFVYIDDVLVLDIGGLHASLKAEINFNTGAVTNYKLKSDKSGFDVDKTTNLKTIFNSAKEDGQEVNWTGNTFDDYTRHTMKIFYMERGEGEANCYFDFNLATMPEDSIQVAKVRDASDKEEHIIHKDEDYMLYVEHADGTPVTGKYEIYKGGVGSFESYVGQGDTPDGVVTLKADQVAVFPGFDRNSAYNVYEYDPFFEQKGLEKYEWNMTINSNDDDHITSTKTVRGLEFRGITDVAVSKWAGVRFINKYQLKTYSLKIYREDDIDKVARSTLQVKMNGEPLTNHAFKLFKKDGTEVSGTYKTDTNGYLVDSWGRGLVTQAGQYVLFENIELNVPIEVITIDASSKDYYNTYEASDKLVDPVSPSDMKYIKAKIPDGFPENLQSLVGEIKLSLHAKNDFEITKTTEGSYADKTKQFEMSVLLYKNQNDQLIPFTPESNVFDATITRNNGSVENVQIVILNGDEGQGPAGSIMIKSTQAGKTVYSYIKLADGDKLNSKLIVPYNGQIAVYEELNGKGEWQYQASALTKISGFDDQNLELSNNIPEKDQKWNTGTNHWESTKNSNTYEQAGAITVAYKNTLGDVPVTGFKLNEILPSFIVAVILVALAFLIYKAFRLRQRRR